MDRAERRYRTWRAASRRQKRNGWQNQPHGWFRKWNGTCQCSMCQMYKHYDIMQQRMKDLRRNGPPDGPADQ